MQQPWSPEATMILCRCKSRVIILDNEFMLQSMRKYPDQLIGFVEVDPRSSEAVETVKHYLGEGLGGLKLLPHFHAYIMSDHSLLDPVLEVCAGFRVPVFILAFDDITNTPLQIEEMARTFPDIPAFVIGQMGRKWLMDEAFMVAERTENVYLETSDTSIDDLQAAIAACGTHKVLYASHWYPDVMEQHLNMHRQAIPETSDLELVLGGNAARILEPRKA
jgi:hypothetical protein